MFEFFVAYHVVKDLAAADAAASPIVVATMWAECESEALIVVLNPVVVTIVNEVATNLTNFVMIVVALEPLVVVACL